MTWRRVCTEPAGLVISLIKKFYCTKNHPHFRALLAGDIRLAYGAPALTECGLQSLPRLDFPGGALIGEWFEDRGVWFGTQGMTGMLAVEAAFAALHPAARLVSTAMLKEMDRHPTLLCMCVRFPYICRNDQHGYTGAVESSRSPASSLSSLSRYNRTDTDKSAVNTGECDAVFLDPQHVPTGPTAMPNGDHDARAQLQAPSLSLHQHQHPN
ncbi:hypothetical protein K438DRAFT_1993368 [Mycena galopus ATCC 62051]|nr:hypothetical protein K438DRAFT_1993368 [Mycena galopus ATCC 62051]